MIPRPIRSSNEHKAFFVGAGAAHAENVRCQWEGLWLDSLRRCRQRPAHLNAITFLLVGETGVVLLLLLENLLNGPVISIECYRILSESRFGKEGLQSLLAV